MQDSRTAAGGARGKHPGHGGRRPQHKEQRRGHAHLRAGEGDEGPLPGGQWARDDQAGAVSRRLRRSFLPGVQVSAAEMHGDCFLFIRFSSLEPDSWKSAVLSMFVDRFAQRNPCGTLSLTCYVQGFIRIGNMWYLKVCLKKNTYC